MCQSALPYQPTTLRVTDITPNSVQLTWNRSPDQAYALRYGRRDQPYYEHNYYNLGTASRIRISGLRSNTIYQFRITTYNLGGDSLTSEPIEVMPY